MLGPYARNHCFYALNRLMAIGAVQLTNVKHRNPKQLHVKHVEILSYHKIH